MRSWWGGGDKALSYLSFLIYSRHHFSTLHSSVILLRHLFLVYLSYLFYVTSYLLRTLLRTDVLEPRPESSFSLPLILTYFLCLPLSLSCSPSHFLCLTRIPYLGDLTGKGEFHNMICHNSFYIWCQALCSLHQPHSLVPMSQFLPFSLPPFLPLLFPATFQSICLFM